MKNQAMFQNILGAVKKFNEKGGGQIDAEKENAWRCETDRAGNGYALIRFLPGKTDDDLPFAKKYDHGFQGPTGKWYIEGCPTTIGHTCPVCESNSPLWNSGNESDKEIVRKRKRRLSYTSNVLVISDSKNPENEGKVFTFKFGKKIFDKIADAMQPPVDDSGALIDPDYPAINPFDLDEGANFKLKIRKVEGYANFDKSEFEKPSAVANATKVMGMVHDLNFLTAPENFKSFEALETKLNSVISGRQAPAPRQSDADEIYEAEEVSGDRPVKKPAKAAPKVEEGGDDDSDLNYFRRLAAEDSNE